VSVFHHYGLGLRLRFGSLLLDLFDFVYQIVCHLQKLSALILFFNGICFSAVQKI